MNSLKASQSYICVRHGFLIPNLGDATIAISLRSAQLSSAHPTLQREIIPERCRRGTRNPQNPPAAVPAVAASERSPT